MTCGAFMTICGIEIKGSEAIFALASQGANGLEHVANATKKIALDDDEDAANVKAFAAQIAAFVKANSITRIAIKKTQQKRRIRRWPHDLQDRGHHPVAGRVRGAIAVTANPQRAIQKACVRPACIAQQIPARSL